MRKLLQVSPMIICVVALLVAATIFSWRTLRAHAQDRLSTPQDQFVQIIPAPVTWQPVDAELTQETPGFPVLVGHFYRASDGSERRELATEDGAMHLTTIINMRAGFQYACVLRGARNDCQRFPASERVRVPVLRRVATAGLTKSTEVHEGLELYEYVDAGGHRSLQAPALNFLPVREEMNDGSLRKLKNIHRGEPSPSVFDPPNGATMTDRQVPKH